MRDNRNRKTDSWTQDALDRLSRERVIILTAQSRDRWRSIANRHGLKIHRDQFGERVSFA